MKKRLLSFCLFVCLTLSLGITAGAAARAPEPNRWAILRLELNGGKCEDETMAAQSGKIGAVVDLSAIVPEREGFEFTGWYRDNWLTERIESIKLEQDEMQVFAGWKATGKTTLPFTDVSRDDWFYSDVLFAYSRMLMCSSFDTAFYANSPVTRLGLVAALWALEGYPEASKPARFTDVGAAEEYSSGAISWAVEQNIATGYDDGRFGLLDPITREQMAAMLYRYMQSRGEGFTGSWYFPLDFDDADQLHSYADEAMHWCVMKGLIGGVNGGRLDPQGGANRAQLAAILHRLVEPATASASEEPAAAETGTEPETPEPAEPSQPAAGTEDQPGGEEEQTEAAAGTQPLWERPFAPGPQILYPEKGGSALFGVLTLDGNGGEDLGYLTETVGTTIDLDHYTPKREGYTFTGWFADKRQTSLVHSITLRKGSAVVYAGWRAGASVQLPYTDVSPDDWFYSDVCYVHTRWLMQGRTGTRFGPDDPLTRKQLAYVLWVLDGYEQVTDALSFSDVEDTAANSYQYPIRWAVKHNIVTGYDDGRFGPDDPITREQLAAMLYRYAQYRGEVAGTGAALNFADADQLHSYAEQAMRWCVGKGLIGGVNGGRLAPQGGATRVQLAVILRRMLES